MSLLSRYLAREIYASVALVLVALLMLFSFFDLINEMGSLGRGSSRIGYVLLFVVLTMPTHLYEIFPVGVLIGTILALVQMAAHSELMVFRASGVSLRQMVLALVRIGIPLVILNLLCGELLTPPSERLAQELKLKAQHNEVTMSQFRSGIWARDGHRFVNARAMLPDSSLLNVNIYEFDDHYHLLGITAAKRAVFDAAAGSWSLEDVVQTLLGASSATVNNVAQMEWQSTITPDLLNVLLVPAEQMSIWSLFQYTTYLRENHQTTTRYDIAMWNKLMYPAAILVMMLLALPFAALQRRTGGVSGKIFAGIVLGLSFHFVGRLFANLGSLYDWPPVLSATAINWVFLMLAGGMVWWTERR
jgi:lipopolysaccharide export system permease protein